jgi:4-carboxymuconolactone decarboxylase
MTDTRRLPKLGRADLNSGQVALYDAFVEGPRQSQASFFPVADSEGVLSGPYRAMLLSPALGAPLERLGRAVRYEASIPERVREMAILTVAKAMDSDVEWQAHEGMALAAGVPERTVQTLRAGSPEFESTDDELAHQFTLALLEQHEVDDAMFAVLERRHGLSGSFELIATIGYYQVIAHINNAFALDRARDDGEVPS